DSTVLKNHIDYDAFGRILAQSDATIVTVAYYTGRYRDLVTGLQYNRARWYDAHTGRWLSEDPIGFEWIVNRKDGFLGHPIGTRSEAVSGRNYLPRNSLWVGTNCYTFAGNDPVAFVDPQGTLRLKVMKGAGWQCGGKPGLHVIDIIITNSPPCEGYLVQEVTASCTEREDCLCCSEMFCDPGNPKEEFVFYEAFPVKWDMTRARHWEDGAIKPGLRWAEDESSFVIQDNACGMKQVSTVVKYFCRDRTEEYGMGTGNLEELWGGGIYVIGRCMNITSGANPGTRKKPHWWDDGSAVPVEGPAGRITGVTYNCCESQPTQFVAPYGSAWGNHQ
ncbi:MAG: RHS repeat-associated core domain-containing protein, partial [bacterium]